MTETTITLPAADLLEALKLRSFVSTKTPVPILAHAMLHLGTLTYITMSDYDHTVTATLRPSSAGTPVRLMVLPGVLASLVRAASRGVKGAEVTLRHTRILDKDYLFVECDGFVLPMPAPLDPADYPTIPGFGPHYFVTGAEAFKDMVKQSISSASKDDTLPILTGVQLAVSEGEVKALSTDRYRMHLSRHDVTTAANLAEGGTTALVRSESLRKMALRIPKGSSVTFGGWFGAEDEGVGLLARGSGPVDWNFSARTVDGDYPKINTLLHEEKPVRVVVDTAAFRRAVKVACEVADATTYRHAHVHIDMTAAGVKVSPVLAELFDMANEVPAMTIPEVPALPGTVCADELKMMLNAKFMLESIADFSGPTVTLHVGSVNKPLLVTDTDRSSTATIARLIMPVRMPGQ